MIPYGRQEITRAEIDAVVTALPSDYLLQGPLLPRLQGEPAAHMGARPALSVNSATSAIQRGIGVHLHDIPAHTQTHDEATGFTVSNFPQSESRAFSGMSLPPYQGLADGQQERVVAAMDEALVA